MKKFFKNIFAGVVYGFWALIALIAMILVLAYMISGIAAIPCIIVNIVLALCDVWCAPWWLYIVESILGVTFIFCLCTSIDTTTAINEHIEESGDNYCPYYIEGRDK